MRIDLAAAAAVVGLSLPVLADWPPPESDPPSNRSGMREVLKEDAQALLAARSAALCLCQGFRKTAKAQIADEMKYAREGGGVVNQPRIYALQELMRAADERAGEIRGELGKTKPLSCKRDEVRTVMVCALHSGTKEEPEKEEWRRTCRRPLVYAAIEAMGTDTLVAMASRLIRPSSFAAAAE